MKVGAGLYQLGNWKAGKTKLANYPCQNALYQLGNWKAGKTPVCTSSESS